MKQRLWSSFQVAMRLRNGECPWLACSETRGRAASVVRLIEIEANAHHAAGETSASKSFLLPNCTAWYCLFELSTVPSDTIYSTFVLPRRFVSCCCPSSRRTDAKDALHCFSIFSHALGYHIGIPRHWGRQAGGLWQTADISYSSKASFGEVLARSRSRRS